MCFVEFDDIPSATRAMTEMYGHTLGGLVKGGIRLAYSKNPLGVRVPGGSSSAAGGPISPGLGSPPYFASDLFAQHSPLASQFAQLHHPGPAPGIGPSAATPTPGGRNEISLLSSSRSFTTQAIQAQSAAALHFNAESTSTR